MIASRFSSKISHAAHNIIALFHGGAFKVERGEFGLRLHVRTAWSPTYTQYMHQHDIREIRITDGPSPANSVIDIDFLADLPMLEGFASITHRIKDFRPLKFLSRLRALNLGHALPDGPLAPDLRWFPEIERLNLGSRYHQFQQVLECQMLRRLGLTQYPEKNGRSAPLAKLIHLEYLALNASGLHELDALSSLTALQEVDFSLMKNLQSIDGLRASAPNLQAVRFESCPQIGSIAALEMAHQLRTLSLIDCGRVNSISFLAQMTELRELYMGGNTDIVDGKLQFLLNMPKLTVVRAVHRAHYDIDKVRFQQRFNR